MLNIQTKFFSKGGKMSNKKKRLTIGLVAHDNRKIRMLEWANSNQELLKNYCLKGTKGTAKTVEDVTGLKVQPIGHGPEGGDVRIAYNILEGKIDILIFFIDTMSAHGHEHDVQALIRTCVTQNIPLALNVATANPIIRGLS